MGVGAAIAPQPALAASFIDGGKTLDNSYVNNVPGNGNYQITPLLTVGDEVPLLQGSSLNNLTRVQGQRYAFTGIPDGLGLYTQDLNFNYVFVNHELGGTSKSDVSTTFPNQQITGSRVSLFQLDKNMNVLGGMNLIGNAIDSTGAPAQPVSNSSTSTPPGEQLPLTSGIRDAAYNFARFCAGYLAESGFAGGPIWFAPEESGNASRGWAVTPNGTAQALDGLGRYSKENVLAAFQYRAGNPSGRTVLLSTEDTNDSEIYLFSGQQTASDPNGFTNGLLYALKVGNTDFEGQIPNGLNQATWTPVDQNAQLDPTGNILSNFVNQPGRTTNFRRLEDIAEDPNNPGTFYVVTTGTADLPGTDPTNPNTPDTTTAAQAENPYGRLYRFSLNPNDPTGAISNLELLLQGGPGNGVSYDNIVVDSNGNVLLQEDETAFGEQVMLAENRDAGIFSYNIASRRVAPLFVLNENAAGTQFNNPNVPGEWETSGIIEVASNALPGRSSYLFDVQAHTVTGSTVLNGNHVQGGQLILATPVPEPSSTLGLLLVGGAWGAGSVLKRKQKTSAKKG